MPVASPMRSRMRCSPRGPSVIDVSVQWNTMRSGPQSARSFAEWAISSAISASGRFHSPATRARVTWMPRPAGAKRLNCGSLRLLTDGMIRPMRARASPAWPSVRGAVAIASMGKTLRLDTQVAANSARSLSPAEGFAQFISDDSIVTNDSGDLEMVERVVGQLGLADGLVSAPAAQMLDELDAALDWGRLRALLGKRGGAGPGNSSYPAEVLLRCLLLGVWHSLSDPALEAAIADRISFGRFTGLSLHDRTPDHTTLWRFRQELAQDGLVDRVFAEITRQLEAKNLVLKRGTLIDASLVAARAKPPRKPRGEAAEAPTKPCADPDARGGRKGHKSVFGYKIHLGVDAEHTIIRRVNVTNASVTDTEPADGLISGDEQAVYGDQAYYTHARHARLREAGIKDRLMRRP